LAGITVTSGRNGGDGVDRDPIESLAQLVALAEKDLTTALAGIRELFNQYPDLWQRYGDMARQVELELIDLIAAGNIALKEATLRKTELANTGVPLERLLAANLVTNWLAVAHADLAAIRARTTLLPQAAFLERRRDQAQRRFLTAIKTLAIVRKLLLPSISPIEIATAQGPRRRSTRNQRCGSSTPVGSVN
jgi:hypothetical protein